MNRNTATLRQFSVWIFFLPIILLNTTVFAQCIVADVGIPTCIEVGDQVTFINNSNDNNTCTSPNKLTRYYWEIYDNSGNLIWDTITIGVNVDVTPPTSIFLTPGVYNIYLEQYNQ